MLGQAATMADPNVAYTVMAAVMIGGMVPPIAIALATTFFKNRFTQEERKSGPVNYIMGLCFITEGVFPFVASDPIRVIAACTAGSVVSGALAVFFGCQMPIPHGGVFAVPFCEKPFMFLLAFVIGCLVTAVILIALKPKKAEDSQDIEAELTEEIEFTI